MKIFVDGTHFLPLVGINAMAISTLKLLQEIFPNAEFTILSLNPEIDHGRYDKFGFNLSIEKRVQGGIRALCTMANQCRKADLAIGLWGDGFVIRNNLVFAKFIAKTLFATLPGKPVVIFPSSMGPFAPGWRRLLARWAANKAKLIAAREEITYRYLSEAGIDKELIAPVPDIAFLCPQAPQERLEQILTKENIKNVRRPLVGMRVGSIKSHYGSSDAQRDYNKLMAQVVDYLITSLDATVLLVPYAIWPLEMRGTPDENPKPWEDDIAVMKQVFYAVQHQDSIVLIKNEYDATEFTGIVSNCDLFIGLAMHCNILAASAGVPAISTDFRYKTSAVMEMVGLEKYSCDLKTVTYTELTSKIDDLWMNRQELRKMLECKMNDIKTSIYSFGEDIRKLVDASGKLRR